MNKYLLLLAAIAAAVSIGHAQAIKTLSVDFNRVEQKSDAGKEYSEGTVYFKFPDYVSICLHTPIKQNLYYHGSKLDIWYPDSSKAIGITAKIPITVPFFSAFVSAITDDFGLSLLKYKVESTTVNNDTVISVWSAPKQVIKYLPKVTLKQFKNCLVSATTIYPKEKIIYAIFSNHVKIGRNFYPLTLTQRTTENAVLTAEETVNYSNLQININLDDTIFNPQIPKNCYIKHFNW